jgi:hypothetical protein
MFKFTFVFLLCLVYQRDQITRTQRKQLDRVLKQNKQKEKDRHGLIRRRKKYQTI